MGQVDLESYKQIIEDLCEDYGLTRAEKEIASNAYFGMSGEELSEEMHVSLRTVKFHLTNIYNKFGVKSRPKFMRICFERILSKI